MIFERINEKKNFSSILRRTNPTSRGLHQGEICVTMEIGDYTSIETYFFLIYVISFYVVVE
jgi:hypothetical protein